MTPTVVIAEKDIFATSSNVVLDRCTITRDKVDISSAVACMMASYFVYGIAYPRKLTCSLLFLERYICQLSIGSIYNNNQFIVELSYTSINFFLISSC